MGGLEGYSWRRKITPANSESQEEHFAKGSASRVTFKALQLLPQKLSVFVMATNESKRSHIVGRNFQVKPHIC